MELVAIGTAILVPLFGLAAAFGGQRVLAKTFGDRLDKIEARMEATLGRFGERMGSVEGEIKALHAVRRATGTVPVRHRNDDE